MLLFAMLAGTAVKVSASMPPFYEFGTWTGKDNISVNVPNKDYNKFLKLSYEEEEINPMHYTVTADGNDTVITLKKDYLKTLAKGTYHFHCFFSAEGEEIRMFGMIVDSIDPRGVEYPNVNANYTLTRLTSAGENVDPSYYTATKDKGYTQVIFKDDAPPMRDLTAYFSAEYIEEFTTLIVDPQEFPSDETPSSEAPADTSEESMSLISAISNETATSDSTDEGLAIETSDASTDSIVAVENEADSNSKTGNSNGAAALTILVIVLVSVSGCVALGVVLLKRYKNKKDHD